MAELYLFNNNGIVSGFTPALISRNFNSVNYVATAVTRNGISLTDSFAKGIVTFTFACNHWFAKELLANIPEIPITIQIFRNDLPYWSGRVTGAKADGATIAIECDAMYTTLARTGITAKATLTCRHLLYSPNCGVVQNLWGNTFTGVTASSTSILVSGLPAAGTYDGGIITLNGQTRKILTQTVSHVNVSNPFRGTITGTATLYPGCGLTMGACAAFGNLDNFGGFPFIPHLDPFGTVGVIA